MRVCVHTAMTSTVHFFPLDVSQVVFSIAISIISAVVMASATLSDATGSMIEFLGRATEMAKRRSQRSAKSLAEDHFDMVRHHSSPAGMPSYIAGTHVHT